MADYPTFIQGISLAYGMGMVLGAFLLTLFEAVDFFKEK